MEEEFGLAAWVTRNLSIVIGIVVVFTVLGGWLWWNHHQAMVNAAAVPKAAAIQNKAQANAGAAAVNITNDNAKKGAETDAKVQHVTNNFNTYPAAKVAIDPGLFDAFDRGVCVFRSAASLPECQRLQQPNPQ